MKTLPQPWSAAMEATVFSGWIYQPARFRVASSLRCCPPIISSVIFVNSAACGFTFDSRLLRFPSWLLLTLCLSILSQNPNEK